MNQVIIILIESLPHRGIIRALDQTHEAPKTLIFLVFVSSFTVLQRSRIKYKKNYIYIFNISKHEIQFTTFM